MTTANKITIARILLVPVFIAELVCFFKTGDQTNRFIAIAAFLLAVLSDGIDGYVARRFNQSTKLGTMLDPLADKFLLVSAIVLISFDFGDRLARIPFWLTAILIGRDLLVSIGIGTVRRIRGDVSVRPRISGKIALACEMTMVLWILLKWPEQVLPFLFFASAVFTLFSGVRYFFDGLCQLNASPANVVTKDH